MAKEKRIVVIGGGTGVFTVLSGLKKHPHHLSAIVTMADDGGSTGQLREEFGILPPGDVRRALLALADSEAALLAELFTYRFEEGEGLSGHSMGNLLLTALERITGSFERSIGAASQLLGVSGKVIPVTLDDVRLKAVLSDGTEVLGESEIDVPKKDRLAAIDRVELVGRARANPRALDAIATADLVVIGPGDLYTSLLPNLVVAGIVEALRTTSAKKVYIVNVMTKHGETDGFSARDFVDAIERVVGKGTLDIVVVNNVRPPKRTEEFYASVRKSTEPVVFSEQQFADVLYKVVSADVVKKEGDLIRHSPESLAAVIHDLLD